MATYDQDGNTVYPTADPDIVKEHLRPGQTPPVYATTVPDGQGGQWAYYPTQAALAMGKVLAAIDTVAEIPGQVAEQARGALKEFPNVLLWGIVGIVVFELLARRVSR